MSLTKHTVRALAASVAIVAVGATVAGAAVFQLPILGFGRADVASANVASTGRVAVRAVPKKVRPKVVVKTKYVDDIVHRRAPAPAYSARSSAAAPAAWVASYAPAPVPVVAPRPTIAASVPATTTPTTAATRHDDAGAHETEHEGPPHTAGTTPSTSAPAGDQ